MVLGVLWPRVFEWYFGFFVPFNGTEWYFKLPLRVPLSPTEIGHVSLAVENKVGGTWGQEVHILHVDI